MVCGFDRDLKARIEEHSRRWCGVNVIQAASATGVLRGLSGGIRSAGSHRRGEASLRRPVHGDRWLQAGARSAPGKPLSRPRRRRAIGPRTQSLRALARPTSFFSAIIHNLLVPRLAMTVAFAQRGAGDSSLSPTVSTSIALTTFPTPVAYGGTSIPWSRT